MTEEAELNKTPSAFERQWHYKPEVPIKVSPFMNWPFDPLAAFKWVRDRWFFITETPLLY